MEVKNQQNLLNLNENKLQKQKTLLIRQKSKTIYQNENQQTSENENIPKKLQQFVYSQLRNHQVEIANQSGIQFRKRSSSQIKANNQIQTFFSNTSQNFSKKYQKRISMFNRSESTSFKQNVLQQKQHNQNDSDSFKKLEIIKQNLNNNLFNTIYEQLKPKPEIEGQYLKIFEHSIFPKTLDIAKEFANQENFDQISDNNEKPIFMLQEAQFNRIQSTYMSFVYFCIPAKNRHSPLSIKVLFANNNFKFKLYQSSSAIFPQKFNCDASYEHNAIFLYSYNRKSFTNDYFFFSFLNERNCDNFVVFYRFGIHLSHEEKQKLDLLEEHKKRMKRTLPCENIKRADLEQEISIFQLFNKKIYNQEQIKEKRKDLLIRSLQGNYVNKVEFNRSNAFEFRKEVIQEQKNQNFNKQKLLLQETHDRKLQIEAKFVENRMQNTNTRILAKIIVQAHKFVNSKFEFKRLWFKTWLSTIYQAQLAKELWEFLQRKVKYKKRQVWLMLQLKCYLKGYLRKIRNNGDTFLNRVALQSFNLIKCRYSCFNTKLIKYKSQRIMIDILLKNQEMDKRGFMSIKFIRRIQYIQIMFLEFKKKINFFRQMVGQAWDNNFLACYLEIKNLESNEIKEIDKALGIDKIQDEELHSPLNIKRRGRTLTRLVRMGSFAENKKISKIKKLNNQTIKNFYITDYIELLKIIYRNNLRKHLKLFNSLSNEDKRLIKLTRMFKCRHTLMEDFAEKLNKEQEKEYEEIQLENSQKDITLSSNIEQKINEEKPTNKLLERVKESLQFSNLKIDTGSPSRMGSIQKKISQSPSRRDSKQASRKNSTQLDKDDAAKIKLTDSKEKKYNPNAFEQPELFILPTFEQLKQMIGKMLSTNEQNKKEEMERKNQENEKQNKQPSKSQAIKKKKGKKHGK